MTGWPGGKSQGEFVRGSTRWRFGVGGEWGRGKGKANWDHAGWRKGKESMPDSRYKATEGSGSGAPLSPSWRFPAARWGPRVPRRSRRSARRRPCVELEGQRVGRPAGLEVSGWVSALGRGCRDEEQAGRRQATDSGLDGSARRTLKHQRDWEQKRRRDLRRRHTFYSPRKRARAPPPSGQLASRTRRTSSQ